MMTGRLNSFQRTMLQWNELHPYNAVAVFPIPAPLDAQRLSRLIDDGLQAWGLTHLTLDQRRGAYHYAGGPVACGIKNLDGGADPEAVLGGEIEWQLNTRFILSDGFNPFRFFTLPGPEGFSLGVVFFHVVADGGAIALMIRDIINAYLKPEQPPVFQPLEIYPRCRDGLFANPRTLLKKLASLPALVRNMRNSSRRICRNEDDFSNRFTRFALGAEEVTVLARTARDWNVTVNDLFLSLILECFSRLPSDRHSHPRRNNLSVGCIVNIRKGLELKGRRAFGPFLGSFVVTHGMPEGLGLKKLSHNIRRQTLIIKKKRLYLATAIELALGRLMFTLHSPGRRKNLYAKNYPLWGGITNMAFDSLWDQPPGEKPAHSFAAVSTGPAVPLVFMFVTVKDSLSVSITYRPSFYTDAEIAMIKKNFLERLAQLKQ